MDKYGCLLNDTLEYDLGDMIINCFRRAMGSIVEALHHMEKCLPANFVDTTAALENTPSQFFHLQIH